MSDTNDVFQVEYLPKQKEIRINLPEELWKNIDTIVMTKLFQKELVVEKQKESMEDTCVCCGEYVPEGRMVCYSCEKLPYSAEQMTNCPLKLDKQVPQKVKKYKGLNETACPNCRFVFGDYEYDDEKFDYCYNCGQRLSWESEVEHDA
jgi:hypothetical protein